MKKCILLLLSIVLFSPQGYSQEESQTRNNITWNLVDMGLQRFTMDYERMNKNGNMSVIIPLSYRFGDINRSVDTYSYSPVGDIEDFRDESEWYIGFGFMFHPISKPTKVRFFFGPEIRFGEASHINYYYIDDYYIDDYEYSSSYYQTNEDYRTKKRYAYAAFLVDVGLKYYPIKQLFMGVKVGIGAYGNHEDSLNGIISPAFKMGYSF